MAPSFDGRRPLATGKPYPRDRAERCLLVVRRLATGERDLRLPAVVAFDFGFDGGSSGPRRSSAQGG